MAIPVYRVNILGRGGDGPSAVGASAYASGKVLRVSSALAAASYRAGEPLRDHQLEQTFDYSSRDDVKHSEILAPAHAPAWVKNRETLWNEVDRVEKRKDAQLARGIMAVLPRTLPLEQSIDMLREHLQEHFVSKGMVADFAVHENISRVDGKANPHAHVMLTLREFNPDGTWAEKKNRDWNDKSMLLEWRDGWEKITNAYLEKEGSDARMSMKSYKDQGIDKLPQQHLGPKNAEMERNGIATGPGNYNRWVEQRNMLIEAVKGWARRLFTREKPEVAREEVKRPEYTQEDIKAYYAKQEARAYRVDEPSIDEMKKWEQRREDERTVKEKAERGSEAKRDTRPGAKPEAATRPRRVASPEDRDHYAAMRPFLQNYPWESRKDMLHFIAVTSKYMHQKKAEARRDPFERLDGTRDAFRYRAVYQDKPIPKQGRERSRGGRER